MKLRPFWVMGWFAFLGCHSLTLPPSESEPESATALWQQGQAAMLAGEPDRATGFYEKSLASDPLATRSHLSLAAAYLEKGQDQPACEHLDKYLQANPDHHQVRLHHAELLARLERLAEAKAEFQRFIADA